MSTILVTVDRTWDGRLAPANEWVNVEFQLDNVGLHVDVDAPFNGDPAPEAPPGSTWELWNHEVVEVFIAGPGERYTEIELGPHGHYLGLRLNGTRNIVQADLPVACRTAVFDNRWRGTVSVPLEHLPIQPWRFNVTAIRGKGAERKYYSVAPLPGNTPDFHRLDRFMPLGFPMDKRYTNQEAPAHIARRLAL